MRESHAADAIQEVTKGKSSATRTIPYQGTGAKCVNSLSARLLQPVLPANATFFKMSPDGMDANQLAEQAGIQQGELEMGLAEIERTVVNDIETSGMRGRIGLLMKHLVGVSNEMLSIPDEGKRYAGIMSFMTPVQTYLQCLAARAVSAKVIDTLGVSAAFASVIFPTISLPAMVGLACILSSLGTCAIERLFQRILGGSSGGQ